jgi:hypothetical protein
MFVETQARRDVERGSHRSRDLPSNILVRICILKTPLNHQFTKKITIIAYSPDLFLVQPLDIGARQVFLILIHTSGLLVPFLDRNR